MKRVTMARFKCMGCGIIAEVELEYAEQVADLPEGWCGLNGWWRETKPRVGEASATQGEGMPQMDKFPLDIECCSYRCMGKFIKGELLRADTQTQERTNARTPQAEPK